MRSVLLFLAGFLPQKVFAYQIEQVGRGDGIDAMWSQITSIFPHIEGNGVYFITGQIINFVLLMIGGVAVVVIIYAGLQMVLGPTGDSRLADAKKMIMYAVVGLILALLGDVVMGFVLSFLNGAASGSPIVN